MAPVIQQFEKFGTIRIGHSTNMKEEHEAIALVLKKNKEEERQ